MTADTTADTATDPVAAMVMEFKRELEALPHTSCLTTEDAEAVYTLAYREYTRARYPEALRFFQLLLVYRPTNSVYLLGAALCLQRMRRYERAIAAYIALHYLEPQQPGHMLAVAECQLLCHDHTAARESLAQVIDSNGASDSHDPVRARAQAMLELMRSQNVIAA